MCVCEGGGLRVAGAESFFFGVGAGWEGVRGGGGGGGLDGTFVTLKDFGRQPAAASVSRIYKARVASERVELQRTWDEV